MKNILVPALCLSALVTFADEPAAEAPTTDAPAAPAKVEKIKTPSVSLSLKAFPLISKSSDSNKIRTQNSFSPFNSQTKTQTLQMKWNCSVRVRERVPEGFKLEVFYIGQDAMNKWVQIGETSVLPLTLDDKGVWNGELLSPETQWTERKKNKNARFNNSSNDLPEKEGERIKGCIVRAIGEDKIWKTFTSDPRWAKAAKKADFVIGDLNPDKSRIGSK